LNHPPQEHTAVRREKTANSLDCPDKPGNDMGEAYATRTEKLVWDGKKTANSSYGVFSTCSIAEDKPDIIGFCAAGWRFFWYFSLAK
jgi:hypothetical protein